MPLPSAADLAREEHALFDFVSRATNPAASMSGEYPCDHSGAPDPPVVGNTSAIFGFHGTETQIDLTLQNPYTNEQISIQGLYNVNSGEYTGDTRDNSLIFTPLSDFLQLTSDQGEQVVSWIDIMEGGDGNDVIILSHPTLRYGDTTILGNNGNDLIWANACHDTIFGGDGDDEINGGPGNDELRGEDDNDILSGASGHDDLYGGHGNDLLIGHEGNDLLNGDAGNDFLNAGAGVDALHGGPDTDNLYFNADNTWNDFAAERGASFITRNAGDPANPRNGGQRVSLAGYNQTYDLYDGGDDFSDALVLTDGSDAFFLHDLQSPFAEDPSTARLRQTEVIDAGEGDDLVDLTSNSLTYGLIFVLGGDGNDIIWANAGNDFLSGDEGDDELAGNSGDDVLSGGVGNNILYVGLGRDEIHAGDGSNSIVFTHFDEFEELVNDFTTSGTHADTLDLSRILQGYDPATDDINDFVSIGTFTDSGDNSTHPGLFVNQDGDVGGDFTGLVVLLDTTLSGTVEDLINAGVLIVDPSTAPANFEDADFDLDGAVDGEDFLAWQRGEGDANGDETTDAADLGVFAGQYGTLEVHPTGPGGTPLAAVPEPGGMSLVISALLPVCWWIRRKRES